MKDHTKNENLCREAYMEPMTTVLRKRRLRWYGHVLIQEGRGMIPQIRCYACKRRDIEEAEAREEMAGHNHE